MDLFYEVCFLFSLGFGFFVNIFGFGFYIVSDYKEILRYVKFRYIEVILEIDVSGYVRFVI